jgi:purine nucleosidase
MEKPRLILVDTDIGSDIDDALALLLLLHLEDVALLGITTVYGNVALRAKIARRILEAAGQAVPVVVGTGVPMSSPLPVWHMGVEGVGLLNDDEAQAPSSNSCLGEDAP